VVVAATGPDKVTTNTYGVPPTTGQSATCTFDDNADGTRAFEWDVPMVPHREHHRAHVGRERSLESGGRR
jgi:hypothetical protein